jgi:hypothetical protein
MLNFGSRHIAGKRPTTKNRQNVLGAGDIHEELLRNLRLRSHNIGQSGITHDGKLIIAVDGRMMTLPRIEKLLEPKDSAKR